MLTSATAGLLTGLSLIVAIGAQNALVLRQGLARRHVGPVVAVCALSDLVLIVAGFFAALFTPVVRRLGVDLRFWIASYALYLLAVFFPQSSTFRLLVPLFPALGALAQPRSRWYRVVLVVVFIAGQAAWVHIAWWVDGYDWTPP